MNKADLIDVLAPRLGGRTEAALAVESFVDVVLREVAAGGSVGITGFGTFERVERAARTGRNPRTGAAVPIAATVSPRFRPGSYFKNVVTDPSELPEDALAGARVSSVAEPTTAAAAPASVRRTTARPAAKATRSTTSRPTRAAKAKPETVRATAPVEETSVEVVETAPAAARVEKASKAKAKPKEKASMPSAGVLVPGGEEITEQILSAKKAQLAQVKNDEIARKKSKKDKDKRDKKKK